MMQDPSAHFEDFDWREWLKGLDLEQPLSELIADPAWLEGLTFSPDELAQLEELGQEYAQELLARDAFPETPPMDMPDTLLAPEHAPEQEHDPGFDH